MATTVTITTNSGSTNYTLSTGARGPAGAAGSSANVTNSNVNTAIEDDPAASRESMVAERASVGKFHVADYEAVPDAVTLYDAVYTSGDNTLTSATANFTAADEGKSIVLQLSQTSRQITTIASCTSATEVELAAAPTASSSAYAFGITTYGTDNSAYIQNAINAAGDLGGEIAFEAGTYLCTAAPSGTKNTIFALAHEPTRNGASPSYKLKGVGAPHFAFFNEGQKLSGGGTVIYCPNQPTGKVFTVSAANTITCAGHGFVTGNQVFVTSTGTLPTGLRASTPYYVIRIDDNTFNLAYRQTEANAGTPLHAFSVSGSGTFRIFRDHASVIAAVAYDHDVGFDNSATTWGSVPTMLAIEGITIRTVPAGIVDGIQMHLGGSLLVDFCAIVKDTQYSDELNTIADPGTGGARATGIVPPSKLSAYWTSIQNSYIYGYYNALNFTDNCYVNQVVSEYCYIGLYLAPPVGTNAANAGVFYSWRSKYPIYGTGRVNIAQLQLECGAGGWFTPEWAVGNYWDIENAQGGIKGYIGISVVEGNVGQRRARIQSYPENPADLVVKDLYDGSVFGRNSAESLKINPRTGAAFTPTYTITGATGSTIRKYKLAHVLPDGSEWLSEELTVSNGPATLSGSNYISFFTPRVDAAGSFKIYRTSGGGTNGTSTGLLGTGYGPSATDATSFNDTGQVATGDLPTDTTGRLLFENGGSWNGQTIVGSQEFVTTPTAPGLVRKVVEIGNVTTAHTFDLTAGTIQTATLTAASCAFTMPTATAGHSFDLYLKQDGTGGRAATFGASGPSVIWQAGTSPTITTGAGKMDILTFESDGTAWYGSIRQNYTAALTVPMSLAPALWLDASDANTLYNATSGGSLVAADGAVARWEDKSGNARHATNSTSGNRPLRKTAIQNGLDVLRFDGTNDGLAGVLSNFSAMTVFVVVKSTTVVNSRRIFAQRGSGSTLDYDQTGHYVPLVHFTSNNIGSYAASALRSFGVTTPNTYYLMMSRHTGTELSNYYNGTITSGGAYTHTLGNNGAAYGIGTTPDLSSNYLDGDIGEILVFGSALSTDDRISVENYLNAKWAIY